MSLKTVLSRAAELEHVEDGALRKPPLDVIAFSIAVSRKLRNWKKSTLADFARVSLSTVERIERGEPVSDEALDRIAQAFGYEPGHYTSLRTPIPRAAAESEFRETYGNLLSVEVARFTTQAQIREASRCCAYLMHAPGLPEHTRQTSKTYASISTWCRSAWPNNPTEYPCRTPRAAPSMITPSPL